MKIIPKGYKEKDYFFVHVVGSFYPLGLEVVALIVVHNARIHNASFFKKSM
jgi:hypothetical protein